MTTIVVSTREAAHREGIIDRYGLDLVVLAQCTIIAARESLERQYAIRVSQGGEPGSLAASGTSRLAGGGYQRECHRA
jgi:hypothetical protein